MTVSLILPLKSAEIASAVLIMIINCCVFGVTLRKTYKHFQTMHKHGEYSIAQVLLFDGKPSD